MKIPAMLQAFSIFFILAPISGNAQPLVALDLVNVDSPGNKPDQRTHLGSVKHRFAIGKYEVTINQYIAFLNAVASINNPQKPWLTELYHPEMAAYRNIGALIIRKGSGLSNDPYLYENPLGGDGNRPVPWVSWFDCARFANWLHNGATFGANTENGAYELNGKNAGIIRKQARAKWWIPSENEWYKAAFYDPSSKTYSYWPIKNSERLPNECGKDDANLRSSANYNYCGEKAASKYDVGGLLTRVGTYKNSSSYYGTYDQAGNLWEWTDTTTVKSMRIIRGGSWSNGILTTDIYQRRDYPYESIRGVPAYYDDDTGFRLAALPQ